MSNASKSSITKVVLDVLKPHNPNIIEFSKSIAEVTGVKRIDSSVIEVDAETETIKLVIEGKEVDMVGIEEAVERLGGAIHSVDAVVIERTEEPRRK